MTIDASKPTPLRLWGFLLTVGGGVLVAFGSIQLWVAGSGSATPPGWLEWKGIDIPEGMGAFVCGVVLIIGILTLRGVKAKAKRIVAVVLILAGVLAFALAGVVAVTASSRYADANTAAQQVMAQEPNLTLDQALAELGGKISATVKPIIAVTMLGGILGAIGGVLSLALVTRKPEAATEPELA